MKLLLLSLGLGAIPEFLGSNVKKIGFVPTAGDVYDDPWFVRDDRLRLKNLGYELIDINISIENKMNIPTQLDSIDALFIAGGNSFYLLQQLIVSEVMGEVKRRLLDGLPYIGASAGAVIVGPSLEPIKGLDDPSAAPKLTSMHGLGLTSFLVLPHYGKEKYLAKYNQIISQYEKEFVLVPLRDDEAVIVTESGAYESVHSGAIPTTQ